VLAYVEVYPGKTREPLPKLPKDRPFNLQPIAKVDRSRTGKDAIVFMGLGGGAAGGNPGGNFLINCKAYDPLSQGIVAKLNTAEEWELESIGGLGGLGSGTDFPHPFHIHVNPFQVVGRTVDFETDDPKLDPKNPCNWIWQDTVAIPATIARLTPNSPCAVTTCASPRPTPSATATPTATPTPTPSPSPTPTPPACPPIPPNPGHLRIRTRFLIYPGQYVIHCHILIHEDVGMMSNVTIQGSGVGPCEKVSAPPQAAVDCVNKTKAQC
jgi:FtsP/CotA-like multicopper oxidase with cupredoxin domain